MHTVTFTAPYICPREPVHTPLRRRTHLQRVDFEELSLAFRRARRARATAAYEEPGRRAVYKWEALLREQGLSAVEWFKKTDASIHQSDGHLTHEELDAALRLLNRGGVGAGETPFNPYELLGLRDRRREDASPSLPEETDNGDGGGGGGGGGEEGNDASQDHESGGERREEAASSSASGGEIEITLAEVEAAYAAFQLAHSEGSNAVDEFYQSAATIDDDTIGDGDGDGDYDEAIRKIMHAQTAADPKAETAAAAASAAAERKDRAAQRRRRALLSYREAYAAFPSLHCAAVRRAFECLGDPWQRRNFDLYGHPLGPRSQRSPPFTVSRVYVFFSSGSTWDGENNAERR